MGKSTYVLVGDDQVTVTPAEALAKVKEIGLKNAATLFGVGPSTLRTFLANAGFKSVRTQAWVKEETGATGDVLDPS